MFSGASSPGQAIRSGARPLNIAFTSSRAGPPPTMVSCQSRSSMSSSAAASMRKLSDLSPLAQHGDSDQPRLWPSADPGRTRRRTAAVDERRQEGQPPRRDEVARPSRSRCVKQILSAGAPHRGGDMGLIGGPFVAVAARGVGSFGGHVGNGKAGAQRRADEVGGLVVGVIGEP